MTEPRTFRRSGATGFKTPGGYYFHPARDISNCLGMIVNNAVIMENNRLEEEEKDTEENIETLHTITGMLTGMYEDSQKDVGAWITGFGELYDYLGDDPEKREIYGSLCSFIVLNIYSFLFTSQHTAINSGESLNNVDFSQNYLTGLLSLMDDDKRRDMMKEFNKLSSFPVPPAEILQEMSEGYLENIKKYQEQKKNEEKQG